MAEGPDPKETKQLTTGEEDNTEPDQQVKEGSSALKDRAIDEAKE